MFLAMGYTAKELEKLFDPSQESEFDKFFDGPDVHEWRDVGYDNIPIRQKAYYSKSRTQFLLALAVVSDIIPIPPVVKEAAHSGSGLSSFC